MEALNFLRACTDTGLAYPLQTAETAAEALHILRAETYTVHNPRPNVVIMTLPLKQRQGFQFLRIVRNDPSFADLDIIVLSNSELEADVIQAYKYHVQSYIQKPRTPQELTQLITTLSTLWGMALRPRACCLLQQDDSTRSQQILA